MEVQDGFVSSCKLKARIQSSRERGGKLFFVLLLRRFLLLQLPLVIQCYSGRDPPCHITVQTGKQPGGSDNACEIV